MDESTSRKSLPQGVRIRGKSVQIYWERRGEKHIITTPYPTTPQGIQSAYNLRSELINKHEWGILTPADLAKAKGETVEDDSVIVKGVLFQDVAQKFLSYSEAGQGTRNEYRKSLMKHWMPRFALQPINEITADDIKSAIAEIGFKSSSTKNNNLIPLRGVFNLALELDYINKSPLERVKNAKRQTGIPDPFTRFEMQALLDWLNNNLEGEEHFYYWYFELAFWTGCRPSELIALRWADVDWFNKRIKITKSRVNGIEKKATKTHVAREVCMNDRSEKALQAIKAITAKHDYVLICPGTDKPFTNERPQRRRLQEAMEATHVRKRPAYNARHTYATMMLMDGINPWFVAEQLGHSLQTLLKKYAKWIHGDKTKIEMAKLNTK